LIIKFNERIFLWLNNRYVLLRQDATRGTCPEPLPYLKPGIKFKIPTNEDYFNGGIAVENIGSYFAYKKKFSKEYKKMLEENKIKSKYVLEIEINDRFKNIVQFKIDRKSKKLSCVYAKNLTEQLNKLIEHINTPGPNGERLALYPLFISSRLRPPTKVEQSKYTNKLNIWLKEIRERFHDLQDVNERFKIFLFIEGGYEDSRHDFQDELDYYENLREFDGADSSSNPVTLCYLPERNLGIGRKRKIMMLFAEHLGLRRYYFLDDDIAKFKRFDHRAGIKDYIDTNVFDALNFMLKVMEHEVGKGDDNVLTDENLMKWVFTLGNTEVSKFLIKMIQMKLKERNSNKNKLLDLVYAQNLTSENEEVINEIKLKLSGNKTVGQVALLDLKSWSGHEHDTEDLKSNHNPIRFV